MPTKGIQKGRKKNAGKFIQLSLLLAAIAIIALVFVRNNVDFFVTSRNDRNAAEKHTGEDSVVFQQSPSEELKTDDADEEHMAARSASAPAATAANNTRPAKPLTVEILNTECRLADREDIAIRLSLKMYVSSEKIQQEVLLKRENLRVAIRKVMAPKKLSEVVVDKLRSELKTEMNALLDAGAIDDIEFIEFNPIL